MALAKTDHYYVPQPSGWPVVGSIALFLMAAGATIWFNAAPWGAYVSLAGFLVLVYMMFSWFGKVIHESEGGSYNQQVDVSFRWGMSWFIFSEVMFFAAFFGALFYARSLAVPWLGDLEHKLLWPDYSAQWPTAGPAFAEPFTPMAAWGIPALNTLLLLSSGVTVTWAHWALKMNHRPQLILGLVATIALGATFLGFQAYEYIHAYSDLNLKLTTGIYGTTFFMLTGFHGFHVTVGVIMLTVILARCIAGHFRPDHHFAFEAVSWYWHFVDVVWLLLFVLVYWF
jgi:cytochrome c oxidase subunit 3